MLRGHRNSSLESRRGSEDSEESFQPKKLEWLRLCRALRGLEEKAVMEKWKSYSIMDKSTLGHLIFSDRKASQP